MTWQSVVHGHPGASLEPPAPPRPSPALNRRDLEVLRCLADGKSTAQIAADLAVTSNTARTRIRRVQSKLDVTGREAVVRTAQELAALGIPAPRRPIG